MSNSISNKLQSLTPIAAMLAMSLAGVAHADQVAPQAMAPAAHADANCGANKAAKEGKCGIHKAAMGGMKEGKCGEAKCGADKGKKMKDGMVVQP